jgi:hypothetical protein
LSDYVPILSGIVHNCPPDEHEAVHHLQQLLFTLDEHAQNFQAAVAMFELAQRTPFVLNQQLTHFVPEENQLNLFRQMQMRWRFIAARDGAMTIFHFGKTMEAIRSNGLRPCHTIRSMIQYQPLRTANKLFNNSFPHFEKLRHSIAHAAELSGKLKSINQHSVKGFFMQNVLSGNIFSQTYEGKTFSYKLSQTSLQHLITVRDQVFSVFLPFDPFFTRIGNRPGWSALTF